MAYLLKHETMTDLSKVDDIQNKIYTIRGKHVMLDSDLAEIYQVETRVLNQAVKRNRGRFPDDFMFQLTKDEFDNDLISQIVTSNSIAPNMTSQIVISSGHGGKRKLPNVFTEQGVSMLSAVLRSNIAIEVSISVIRAFASMRKFIENNANIFIRLSNLEQKQIANDTKQIETDNKIGLILKALEDKNTVAKQGVFYDGQVFDAYMFVIDLIKTAKSSIILIDNYVDDTVLQMFTKRKADVLLQIYTSTLNDGLKLDVKKFNAQYPPVEIQKFNKSHDRFLIIDNINIYHLGASLKDLGKKWFAFSKMDTNAFEMINKLNK